MSYQEVVHAHAISESLSPSHLLVLTRLHAHRVDQPFLIPTLRECLVSHLHRPPVAEGISFPYLMGQWESPLGTSAWSEAPKSDPIFAENDTPLPGAGAATATFGLHNEWPQPGVVESADSK